MAFPVEKRVDLSFLGNQWQGAEIVFSGLTFKETRELAKVNFDGEDGNDESAAFVTKFLGDHFISGKAWNGTTLVELSKDDIDDLPVEVVNKSIESLAGQADPKS